MNSILYTNRIVGSKPQFRVTMALLVWIACMGNHLLGQTFLDTTFAANGVLYSNYAGSGQGSFVQVLELTDGSYLAMSQSGNPGYSGTVRFKHFDSDGNQDMAYGNAGLHEIDPAFLAHDTKMIQDDEDRIIVVGDCNGGGHDAFVLRLNPDGTPDLSFGIDGYYFHTPPGNSTHRFYDLCLQSDGSIILGGCEVTDGISKFLVIRITHDGVQDLTFATNGKFTAQYDVTVNWVAKIATNAADEIIFCGQAFGNADHFKFYKLTSDGEQDTSFWQYDGLCISLSTMLMSPEGYIYLLGVLSGSNDIGLVCLNADGTPRLEFSDDGLLTGYITDGSNAVYKAMCFDHEYNLILAGLYSDNFLFLNRDITLMRLDPEGNIDYSFGQNGRVYNSTGMMNDMSSIYNMLTTYDDKFILCTSSVSAIVKFSQESVTLGSESNYGQQLPIVVRSGSILVQEPTGYQSIILYDLTGREIYRQATLPTGDTSIDLEAFGAGIYLGYLIASDGRRYSFKIIFAR